MLFAWNSVSCIDGLLDYTGEVTGKGNKMIFLLETFPPNSVMFVSHTVSRQKPGVSTPLCPFFCISNCVCPWDFQLSRERTISSL